MPDERLRPIIYVRGYAMTRSEIDDTTADPFCGFNLGSTVLRATTNKEARAKKFVFESPLVRLGSDFGYRDVYQDGVDIGDPDWEGSIDARSVVIYRYYEGASSLLGDGKTPDIETFAKGLSDLILRVRDLVCADPKNGMTKASFRCYLVAHSMGGLVCRAFLQNSKLGEAAARKCVDKLFTYATPHNGVEMTGINVPSWFGANDLNNFNRKRMAQYLDVEKLYEKTGRVDWIPERRFPSSRVFCMVGTNRADYGVAAGVSRTFAGHGSDGLVQVDSASVWGVDDQGKFTAPSATAHTYRSHSGHFGIVNSEEAYQNLARFLFGDVRVDLYLDIDDVRVPQELEAADNKGTLNANYQIEVLGSPRGSRWFLTRRVSEEDSVAVRSHRDLRDASKPWSRHVYLATMFLAKRYRVDPKRPELNYSLTLGVVAPEYEVDKKFWPNRHYEGQYLFRDAVVISLKPPSGANKNWKVSYDWQSDNVGQAETPITTEKEGSQTVVRIPFATDDASPPRSPGISGTLRFVISSWNA